MKKRMKMLALVLATAVTATSVPYQNVVLAETNQVQENDDFAAYEAAIASFAIGTEAVTKEEPTPVAGVFWDGVEGDGYTYSSDSRTKTQNNVFKGNSVLSSDTLSVLDEELSYDDTILLEKLEYDSGYVISDMSYSYQWHSISQDGTKQSEGTDSTVDPSFTNSDVKKTYLCQVSIESVEVSDENGVVATITKSDLNDKGIATVANRIFRFEYVEDESSKVLWAYDTSGLSENEKANYSKNDTVYTQECEYNSNYTSKTLYRNNSATIQKYNLLRALEIPDASNLDCETEYAWFMEDADGNRTPVMDDYGEPVTEYYCYAEAYAKDGDVTYVCVQTLKSITYEIDDETIELDASDLPAGYSNTVEKVFKFKYTGLTKEDFDNGSADLSDYFYGIDSLEDKTVNFETYDDYEYYNAGSLWVRDSKASMKQTWTAYFTDGTSKVLNTSSDADGLYEQINIYEDVEDEDSETTTRKFVDYYVHQVDFMYYGIVVDTVSKNIKVNYEPFTLYNEGNQTVSVRQNGKYTFEANAYINDYTYCQGLKYQWYSVDKDGKETVLEDETDTTLKKKITDPSVIYKCKVTGEMTENYTGPEAVKETSFSIKTSSGYRLLDRTWPYVSKKVGDDVTFSVKASVDDGYSLKYKWERYGGTDENGNKKITELGKEATCKVTELKEEDFGTLYDSETGQWWRYRVTVSVCKDGETEPVETYVYYSEVYGESEDFDISCENYEVTVYKGEDANLSVNYVQKDGFTIEPQWYMPVASTKVTYKDGEYVSVDSTFETPKHDTYYDAWTDETDENGNRIYERTYYKKIVSDDTLILSADKKTLTAKDAANPGKYVCEVTVYKDAEKEQDRTIYTLCRFDMSVNEKTDLTAYMRTGCDVEAIQGENAKFVVNAANFNTTKCPITYVWEKYDEEKQAYEKIADAETNQLSFEKVKKEDYGTYRVTVKDDVEEMTFNLTLTEKFKDVVVQTPSYTKYTPKIGDTVTMKAESNLTEQDKVFYEWYRMEETYDDSGYWELLNQDTDTYTLNVKEDADYTTYKCIVSYKRDGINYEQIFVYNVQNNHSFTVENTTLKTQYKKLGDSATYGVRVLYKDTEISEDNLTYQWYRETSDYEYEKIEGATGNVYQISAIKPEDFGCIYCRVTDTENGNSEEIYFNTMLYTEAYLQENDETVYVTKGSDVTLQPEIINPEADGYTYQWYRYGEEEEHGYWEEQWNDESEEWEDVYYTYYEYGPRQILHGAVSEKLDIADLMDGDFTKYECVIFYNGMEVMTYDVRLAEETSVANNIEVKSKKQSVQAVVNQRVEMKIEAKSLDGSELKYQWYKGYTDDGNELIAIGDATKDALIIEQVTPDDYGTYTCIISDKNGNKVTVRVYLSRTTNMNVVADSYYVDDTIGYATSFGGTVTLKATASIAEGETLFYQWYKGDKELYGENGATLTLTNVTKDKLGSYRCYVSDVDENSQNLYYLVYVDTGLNAVQSVSDVKEAADGSAEMYVEAVANAGVAITYQWSKWDDEKEAYVDIAGANGSKYKIAQVKQKDYGEYRCVVATDGESYRYDFMLSPEYYSTINRSYAQIGDTVTVSAKIDNPAADAKYTYQWYAEDPKTGTYMRTNCTSATYTTKAPSVNVGFTGYETVGYKCVISDGSQEYTCNSQVRVLRKMDKNTKKLPEVQRSFAKTYDVQNYSIPNAKGLEIVLESGRDIPVVIDGNGSEVYSYNGMYTYKVTGDTVIFLYQNSSSNGAGYKVTSIKAVGGTTTTNNTNNNKATPTPKATEKVTAPGKPTLKSVANAKGKKMTVKISKKVKGAAGYQITYATDSKFKKNKKNVNMTSTSKTINKLKKGTTYYVKVRAYAKDSKGKKVYGSYSKVKKVKIKK